MTLPNDRGAAGQELRQQDRREADDQDPGVQQRRAGVSLETYRDHDESIHAPLAHGLFPTVGVYRRNYIDHDLSAVADTRPGVPRATPSFGSVAEVFFENWQDFLTFRDRSAEPDVRARVLADEMSFLDPSAIQRFVVVPEGDSAWT